MPAPARAWVIFVPSPARSGPSIRTEWRLPVVLRPACWAALFCLAPLMGVRKTTPVPGLSGARRAIRTSTLAPAPLRAVNFSTSPPGRSSISPDHTSTFLTAYGIIHLLVLIAYGLGSILLRPIDPHSFGVARGNIRDWSGSYHPARESVKSRKRGQKSALRAMRGE